MYPLNPLSQALGTAYDWFQSYLQNRAQQVECGGVLSSAKPILSGVPQGSIQGPLLFLVYAKDFPNFLNIAQALMFANDTSRLFSSNNYETLFNTTDKELSNVRNWLVENKSLTVAKTKYVVFQTPHYPEPPFGTSLLKKIT